MSYNLENSERPEDKKKGIAGSTIVHILILILIVWPFFPETTPLEAEGLMASFGDVEISGNAGDVNENPDKPIDEPVEDPIEDPVEGPIEDIPDVTTIDDNTAPVVKETPEPKTDPKPKTDPGSLFTNKPKSGTKGKNGDGDGDGTQGNKDGKKDNLGGTGNGDKGKGHGELGSRRNLKKCDGIAGNWDSKQKAVVYICIDDKGNVIEATFQSKKSTLTDQSLKDQAVACAKEYKYSRAPGKKRSCGDIFIKLGLN